MVASQLGCARCQGPAFRAAGARRSSGGQRVAVVQPVRAAAGEREQQQQAGGLDRRQALLGLAAALMASQAPQAALADDEPAAAEGVEIFYGQATPPTSYGGYGGKYGGKEDAKYIFEYPSGWKSEVVNKRDKGTQGVDCRVYNPKNKLQQVFVITLGRAGEDNRSFRLTDIDSTLSGFAGADYIMQDALTDAVLRVDGQREIDGQLYYDVEFASYDNHYLCSITVNAGKVFAMFIKTPEKLFAADEAKLRAIRDSYRTV